MPLDNVWYIPWDIGCYASCIMVHSVLYWKEGCQLELPIDFEKILKILNADAVENRKYPRRI